jgi:hypothetical protein
MFFGERENFIIGEIKHGNLFEIGDWRLEIGDWQIIIPHR